MGTAGLFVFVVLFVAWVAGRGLPRRSFLPLVLALVYLVIPAWLARSGALDRYDPLPAPALVLVFALTVVTIALAFSPVGTYVADHAGWAGLIGFQAFRVPVEIVLHRLYEAKIVPVQMTYSGQNFDILSGLLAGVIGILIARGRPIGRTLILVWNVAALGLLVNIVIIAVLSTPVPFGRYGDRPPNLLPSTFPYVWLPSFLVQAALFGHLIVFRKLARMRQGGWDR
jgi:hypothetical protein